MPNTSGTVQSIDVKQTQNGKTYYRVNVDGVWYSSWEKPNFTRGQEIEFDVIQKGDFKNLANAKVVEGPATTSKAGSQVSTNRPNGSFDPDRESRIVRQNATSSAVALVGASKVAGKNDVETLLGVVKETAKRIFEMNMYGYDAALAAPKAEIKPNKVEAPDVPFFDNE